MKVLEIVFKDPRSSPGGVESVSSLITDFLHQKGIFVTTVFQVYRPQEIRRSIENEFVCLSSPFPDSSLFLPINKILYNVRLLLLYRKHVNNYDIVHVNGDAGGLLLFKTAFAKKSVVTIHGSAKTTYRKVSKYYTPFKRMGMLIMSAISDRFEKIAVKRAKELIFVSNDASIEFLSLLHKKHFEIIYNGADTNFFFPTQNKRILIEELKLDLRSNYAIWVGKDIVRKGLNVAIKAINRSDNFKLIVVGSEVPKPWKNDKVIPYGQVPKETLRELYQISSLLIFPSVHEGFSVSVMEAMSCGVIPMIYSKSPSSEILTDNFDSILIDNERGFFKSLNKVGHNHDLLEYLSQNARNSAIKYSNVRMCEKYLEVFSRVKAHN